MSEITVRHGDSRDVLKTLADASIDSCVCDPPYALVSIGKRFGKPGSAPAKSDGASGVYARASAGFMGAQWDTGETAFATEFWAEVYRVLKPGAHVVAFSGTRTYHRLACAIEDAGFEIRDMVAWLYGSGFPKSHDVSKSIDKAGGSPTQAQSVVLRQKREAASLTRDAVAAAVGCTPASVRDWEEGRARASGGPVEFIIPSDDYRAKLADLLGYSSDERRLIGVAADRRGDGTVVGLGHAGQLRVGGNTEAARQWEGWGTALKPALEPVVLARKPLDGTVAANVLEHGTGALNIAACRVGGDGGHRFAGLREGADHRSVSVLGHGHGLNGKITEPVNGLGRWPANILHDGSAEVVSAFPAVKTGAGGITKANNNSPVYSGPASHADRLTIGYADDGSAARFFYSSKADAEDRLGSRHPTVKPIDLMAWLCRLVTPPGGVVLDPFAGTGTTGAAAMREGFDCILIEREAQYVADIHRRLAWARGEGRLTVLEKARNVDPDAAAGAGLPLFGGEAA